MDNVSLRKVTLKDFENIYSLILKVYDNTNIVKDNWKKLFLDHWGKSDDFFGDLLIIVTSLIPNSSRARAYSFPI